MNSNHRIRAIPLLIAIVLAGGCGKSDDSKKAATQVAAKVNSTEITVSQINSILARSGKITPEAAERAKREILERLITEELAKAEAITKKLDRNPAVMQAIEATKTEVLARAYVEEVAKAQARPTPEEVKKYYIEHPELFSQRRIYNIEELSLQAKEGLAAALREQVAKGRNLKEVAAWLNSQSIPFSPNSGVRGAEQLPLEFLPKIQPMKDGEIKVFEVANTGITVFRVVASKPAPVDEALASPRIQQFLFSRKSAEAVSADMKQLKEKAKIEYMGEFVASAEDAATKAKAAAEAKAKAAADAKEKAQTETQAKQDELAKARRAAEEKDKAEAEARAKDEEVARARRAAEAKARDEDAKKAAQSKPGQINPDIAKGVGGLVR